jgi:hypothetical protein
MGNLLEKSGREWSPTLLMAGGAVDGIRAA